MDEILKMIANAESIHYRGDLTHNKDGEDIDVITNHISDPKAGDLVAVNV